jgi:hypothetical protein
MPESGWRRWAMATSDFRQQLVEGSYTVLLDQENPWAATTGYRTLVCSTGSDFFVRISSTDGRTFFRLAPVVASYPASMTTWNEYYAEARSRQVPACRCFADGSATYMVVDFMSTPSDGLVEDAGERVFDVLKRFQKEALLLRYGPHDLAWREEMAPLPAHREPAWCPGRAWGVGFPGGAYRDVVSALLPVFLNRKLWRHPELAAPRFVW